MFVYAASLALNLRVPVVLVQLVQRVIHAVGEMLYYWPLAGWGISISGFGYIDTLE